MTVPTCDENHAPGTHWPRNPSAFPKSLRSPVQSPPYSSFLSMPRTLRDTSCKSASKHFLSSDSGPLRTQGPPPPCSIPLCFSPPPGSPLTESLFCRVFILLGVRSPFSFVRVDENINFYTAPPTALPREIEV